MKEARVSLLMRTASLKAARLIGRPTSLLLLFVAGMAHADDIAIKNAWTPPAPEAGVDAVLGMVVTNSGADPDALVRVSCPIANFSEKRQIDIGEGGKSAREIKEIPIPAKSTVTLNHDGFHIALLQTREKLEAGQEFECSVSFRHSGKVQVQVHVAPKAPE